VAKKAGRPKNTEQSGQLIVSGVEPKLFVYLEALKQKQGFGKSNSEIARLFIWAEVNRLIESGRLEEK
jgi:hypothetical protein